MGLINCPECHNEVNDSALQCPNCGVQLHELKRGSLGKLIKYGLILFNILMAIWFIGGIGMKAATIKTTEILINADIAGTTIGPGVAAMMIMGIWGVGDIVMGALFYLTRVPQKS